MDKEINLKMRIRYNEEAKEITNYEFDGEYTAGEVVVIIAALKHCPRDWGFKVTLDEE